MRTCFCLLSCIIAAAVSLPSPVPAPAAEAQPKLVASAAPDWPQWRGPRRDGVSTETGLLATWPEAGPPRLWKAEGIAKGYSSPIVVGETIYITGDAGDDLLITAITLDGKRRWQVKNGKAWKGPYPGARAACCYDDGKLYHLNAQGRLACLDAASGAEQWAVNVLDRFKAPNIIWGISEAVLVHGDRVFVTPCGSEGLMAALDKRTGATVWATPALEDEKACYSAPILVAAGDRLALMTCGQKYMFAVDAENGKLLWHLPHMDPKATVTSTPVLGDGRVYVTNASRSYGGVYAVDLDGLKGTKGWAKEFTVSHGGAVFAENRLVAASARGVARGWLALDPKTGEPTKLSDMPVGSMIYADKHFYCLSERGLMTLQELAADGFKTTGSFQFADGKDVWAHPVILKGRLYLRFEDALYCYDIKAK